jgi:hypothetical protein
MSHIYTIRVKQRQASLVLLGHLWSTMGLEQCIPVMSIIHCPHTTSSFE